MLIKLEPICIYDDKYGDEKERRLLEKKLAEFEVCFYDRMVKEGLFEGRDEAYIKQAIMDYRQRMLQKVIEAKINLPEKEVYISRIRNFLSSKYDIRLARELCVKHLSSIFLSLPSDYIEKLAELVEFRLSIEEVPEEEMIAWFAKATESLSSFADEIKKYTSGMRAAVDVKDRSETAAKQQKKWEQIAREGIRPSKRSSAQDTVDEAACIKRPRPDNTEQNAVKDQRPPPICK